MTGPFTPDHADYLNLTGFAERAMVKFESGEPLPQLLRQAVICGYHLGVTRGVDLAAEFIKEEEQAKEVIQRATCAIEAGDRAAPNQNHRR